MSDKQVFYTHLLQQRSVTWPVERGISFIGCREDCHWGMALHVEHQMMPSEQFRHALAQRFGEARRYADYRFIFDPRQDFVIWRALPGVSNAEVSLEGIRRAQLTLAGFGHLFV
ncbi:type III secretion protein HrpV [Pseudomonas sp. GL-B-16]|uniref:type III secretion protein HrpV n=1 Tax=Pseudomonas sp. GL-B-16 TaxID=2832373 RepID=UPI001CBFDA56|nr:type III secretion protein HrpV [Pseudomonas sp. GL-B-16]